MVKDRCLVVFDLDNPVEQYLLLNVWQLFFPFTIRTVSAVFLIT